MFKFTLGIALSLQLQKSNQITGEKSYHLDVRCSVQGKVPEHSGGMSISSWTLILAGKRVGLKGCGGEWLHCVKAVKREGLLYFQHKRAACKDSRSFCEYETLRSVAIVSCGGRCHLDPPITAANSQRS